MQMLPAQERSRLTAYLRNVEQPHVAIFDVGTRATRLLVAPQKLPEGEWRNDYFFNTRDISRLGGDVNKFSKSLTIADSEALDRVTRFLGEFRRVLNDNGIGDDQIHAIGTAVFRWLGNPAAVLKHIQETTGVKLRILSDKDEAQISLAGITFTHKVRPGEPIIAPLDCIVLIDQGGGSTEISYATADGREGDLFSFDEFGTVALRQTFFTMDGDRRVDPSQNRRRIVTQLERILQLAEQRVARWRGYPELKGRRLHVYGMGSAITNCFPGLSNLKIHNKLCSIAKIESMIELHGNALDYSREQIVTLWKQYQAQEALIDKDEWDNLENRLLALYGLPVFVSLLKRLGVSELRICGYGLRYAYYVWKYHYHAD
jgi:exopolyphosphatase/pppGpp-phosphohydrolase